MQPPQTVRALVAQKIKDGLRKTQPPSLRIWIGHDYGIMMDRELLLGGRFEQLPPISYLDGIVFGADENESLFAIWNGERVRLEL